MSTTDASNYNSGVVNAYATGLSRIYMRDASMPLNATKEDAANIGTLTTNQTQLDVKGQISRANPNHFYKFSLNGDSLKMVFMNNTNSTSVRVQVMNSAGKVVADNSTFASETLQEAYDDVSSSDGLDLDAGDYYIKVTYDSTATRSVPQTYSFGLYSGTKFTQSYQTTAKSQTKESQAVLSDNTQTYQLIDTMEYETKGTQVANAGFSDAINIGWIYNNKSALAVNSMINNVVQEAYYSLTLQDGDALKLAFTNRTNTSDLRIQIYDSSGTKLMADSEGTDAQKEAYEKLTTTGLSAKAHQNYYIKVSYADGATVKPQLYDFNVYVGDYYDTVYTTKASVETLSNALSNGHLVPGYSQKSAAASYLTSFYQGQDVDIMSKIREFI